MILPREYLEKTTCCFYSPSSNIVGTGMFMSDNQNPISAYIITAYHVYNKLDNGTVIIIDDGNKTCINFPLADLMTNSKWAHHKTADLSVLKVDLTNDNIKYFTDRCFPIDHFNLTKICVERDCELTSIGFPLGFGASNSFSPLSYKSFASSGFLTTNRADTNTPSTFFCLDNSTIGGYSGCPIFDLGYVKTDIMFVSKEKTICHGFTHGSIGDANGRMTLITPAFYLSDII